MRSISEQKNAIATSGKSFNKDTRKSTEASLVIFVLIAAAACYRLQMGRSTLADQFEEIQILYKHLERLKTDNDFGLVAKQAEEI